MATSLNDLRKRRMTKDEAIDFERLPAANAEPAPEPDGNPVITDSAEQPDAAKIDIYPKIPKPAAFKDDDGEKVEFCEAPDLEEIGERLINDPTAGLGQLKNMAILYLYKRSSGFAGGIPVLGRLKRPTELESFFEKTDYVLWVSAARANEAKLTVRNMEAEIYHLLLHAEINEDGKPGLVAPDVKGFVKEFKRYGPWREEQKALRKNFRQLSLLDNAEEDSEDETDEESAGENAPDQRGVFSADTDFDPADYESDDEETDDSEE